MGGETTKGWSRSGHSQPAPSPGPSRVGWALAPRLEGTSSSPAAPSGGDTQQGSHPAPNPQPLLPEINSLSTHHSLRGREPTQGKKDDNDATPFFSTDSVPRHVLQVHLLARADLTTALRG